MHSSVHSLRVNKETHNEQLDSALLEHYHTRLGVVLQALNLSTERQRTGGSL